jgi:hypothetical protein
VFIFNRADFVGDHSEDAFLGKREPIPGGVILLDRTQFRTPAAGRMGDAPRNYFRGPGFWNVDLALSRSFSVPKFGEQAWLQFRVELFNVLNHANLNNPDSTLGSFSFGTALFGRQGFGSALPSVSPLNEQPRRIQLAVKVYF